MTSPTSIPGRSAVVQVLDLCGQVEAAAREGPLEERAHAARERLEGPFRVAIAGRVKAGKSTLLNALVGERLAPTGASECTQVVSWYCQGDAYGVIARMTSGEELTLDFRHRDGALDVSLGELTVADIEAIEVQWPASTLAGLTLVDTPGLASLNEATSTRTEDFLTPSATRPIDVDAVIYLIRHVHRKDVEFLDAFMDQSVPGASPVNAVAVLSRADEIGGGRLDALDNVGAIAERYAADEKIRALCAAVVPVAGLLAETGETLREDEAAALRKLAATDPTELDEMLLSADQLCDVGASDLTAETRHALLRRLGMYGVRLAVEEIRSGRAATATELSKILVDRSGVADLWTLLRERFLSRARVLQARATLDLLADLGADLRQHDERAADEILRQIERIEASAIEFDQLRVAHLVLSGFIDAGNGERSEIERMLLADDPLSALDLGTNATTEDIQAAAARGIERWKIRGADPIAAPLLVEVCETMVRSYERIFVTMASASKVIDER